MDLHLWQSDLQNISSILPNVRAFRQLSKTKCDLQLSNNIYWFTGKVSAGFCTTGLHMLS